MATPISHVDERDPFLALDLPSGRVRGLLEPLSGSVRSDDPLESALFETLTGSKPDSAPTSNAVIFTYLAGYDPGIDRQTDGERHLSINYVAERDAFEVSGRRVATAR